MLKGTRLALFAILATAITLVALNRDSLDPATLDAWLSGMGIWAPVVYILLFAVGTVLFAPGALFACRGRNVRARSRYAI